MLGIESEKCERRHFWLCPLIILAFAVTTMAQTPTAFTYQGRLTDAGAPASGVYDFEFKLFDGTGTQLGSPVTREDVQVTNGVFLVQLDFGMSPFIPGAAASTLEIGVRPGTSTGAYTTLSPRQPITSSPYAVQTINAQQLGGVPADQYVKTDDPRLGGPGGNFIQNTTTQQPAANFNIAGNGLFGGVVGIGTQTPLTGLRLDVNGIARFTPGGSGGAIQLGSPGGETGVTISNASTRADLRFNGASLQLLAGPAGGPPSIINGVTVNTLGNVGIGTSNPPTAKLHVLTVNPMPAIYAESPNRGVYGVSTGSSYGVYGESGQGIGVQGASTNNIGTTGGSTNHIGVYGSTAAGDVTKPGVLGVSTGVGGVGVRGNGTTGVYGVSTGGVGVTGEANASGSTGVYGTSVNGTGVTGVSTSGYAMYANGNAGQARDKGGFVKAMIYVDTRLPDGQRIVRCYNGITNSSTGTCGFHVFKNGEGRWIVDFGFQVSDRFFSLTVIPTLETAHTGDIKPASSSNTNSVDIVTYLQDLSEEFVLRDIPFFLIVY